MPSITPASTSPFRRRAPREYASTVQVDRAVLQDARVHGMPQIVAEIFEIERGVPDLLPLGRCQQPFQQGLSQPPGIIWGALNSAATRARSSAERDETAPRIALILGKRQQNDSPCWTCSLVSSGIASANHRRTISPVWPGFLYRLVEQCARLR